MDLKNCYIFVVFSFVSSGDWSRDGKHKVRPAIYPYIITKVHSRTRCKNEERARTGMDYIFMTKSQTLSITLLVCLSVCLLSLSLYLFLLPVSLFLFVYLFSFSLFFSHSWPFYFLSVHFCLSSLISPPTFWSWY